MAKFDNFKNDPFLSIIEDWDISEVKRDYQADLSILGQPFTKLRSQNWSEFADNVLKVKWSGKRDNFSHNQYLQSLDDICKEEVKETLFNVEFVSRYVSPTPTQQLASAWAQSNYSALTKRGSITQHKVDRKPWK